MRIAILHYPLTVLGKRWVNGLAERGHDVHVIYFEGDAHASLEPLDTIPDLVGIQNVTLHPLAWENFKPLSMIDRLLRSYIADLSIRGKVEVLKEAIKYINPDILHAHIADYYGSLGALSGFHPYIVTPWGSDVLKATGKRIHEVQMALSEADVIIPINTHVKEFILSHFTVDYKKVRVVPWGIDLDIFHRKYEQEAKALREKLGITGKLVVLSPRYIKENYRTENIVKALGLLKSNKVALILVRGQNKADSYEGTVRKLIVELNLIDSVKIIDREISQLEMAHLYNASDVVVSIPTSDGFSFALEEGMACGNIPLVCDLPVYHQYLDGNNALFVPYAATPRDIADSLLLILEHPEMRDEFYRINRGIMESSEDWHKNIIGVENLYMEVIGCY